jgi:5-methylcytosine-specific restriction endonuclease McrA
MDTALPAALDSATLSRRLGELARDERAVQVEFLLHLDEYDRRRAFVDAGYASLWDYLTRALHYREGAAYRRITAMKALRRVPALAGALRDGSLCLTTLAQLDEVVTPENAAEILERSAFKSKREVEELVAALRPRIAPRDGVRRIAPRPVSAATPLPLPPPPVAPPPLVAPPAEEVAAAVRVSDEVPRIAPSPPATPAAETPSTIVPISAEKYSLRVTIDAELKKEIDDLKALLSHKVPSGELGAVLREAVRCAIEKHGKRKGAVEPSRKRKAPVAAKEARPRREPTAEVRRQVWQRDGGRCAWVGPDGRRCDSRWQLEYDHVHPAARGGAATVENGRLLCRVACDNFAVPRGRALQLSVPDADGAEMPLAEACSNRLRDRDRAVIPAGTADRDRQARLSLRDEGGDREVEEVRRELQEPLRGGLL